VLLQFVRVLPERSRQTSDQLVVLLDEKRERLSSKDELILLLSNLPYLLGLLRRVGVQRLKHDPFQILPAHGMFLLGFLV
jgi:hypothetical protein